MASISHDDLRSLDQQQQPPSPMRRKGVASDSALDEKLQIAIISHAYEKHKKQYQSAPRTFTYDKIEKPKISLSLKHVAKHEISPRGSVASTSSSQHTVREKPKNPLIQRLKKEKLIKPHSEGQLKASDDSGSDLANKSQPTIATDSSQKQQQQPQQDREVSTSYTESLDQIVKKGQEASEHAKLAEIEAYKKRMSIVPEEDSRPASAAFSDPGSALGDYFDEMNFIKYTSKDMLYEPKKKQAKVIGRYVMGDVLGEGSYGKVKEGFCVETLRRVAVKIMKQAKLKKIPGGEQNVKREISLLKRLRHKNVVELMDVIYCTEKQKIYVVFEYCANTLQDMLQRAPNRKFPLSQSQRYFKQLVKGMDYLHAHSVIHRDIKPGNLLVTIDDTIKISDFGVAEELDRYSNKDTLTSSQGSPAFQPPEVAAGKDSFSGFKVDIWAIGVTLYNMISGKFPFDGDTIYQLFDNIAKAEYKIPPEADIILSDLLLHILEKDPEKRLSMAEIKAHNWLKAEIAKSSDEVKVIQIGGISREISELSQVPSDEDTTMTDFITHLSPISNPHFAYDTTLIPYLENMYEELPQNLRRSSMVELDFYERRHGGYRKSAIAEKFLRRLSRPVVHDTLTIPSSTSGDGAKQRPASASSAYSRRQSIPNSPSFFTRSESDQICKMQ